jgi:hypothetical protein
MSQTLVDGHGVNGNHVRCTTVLRVIPRASQYAAWFVIYLVSSIGILDIMPTPFKERGFNGQERKVSSSNKETNCEIRTYSILVRAPHLP